MINDRNKVITWAVPIAMAAYVVAIYVWGIIANYC
jgi:hypothetical protein